MSFALSRIPTIRGGFGATTPTSQAPAPVARVASTGQVSRVATTQVATTPSVLTPVSPKATLTTSSIPTTPATIPSLPKTSVVVPPRPVGVQSSYNAITNSWTVLNGPTGPQPFGVGTGSSPVPTYAGTPVDAHGNVIYLMQGSTGPILAGGTPTLDSSGNPIINSYNPSLKDQYLSPGGVNNGGISLSQLASIQQIKTSTPFTSLSQLVNVNPSTPIPGVTSFSVVNGQLVPGVTIGSSGTPVTAATGGGTSVNGSVWPLDPYNQNAGTSTLPLESTGTNLNTSNSTLNSATQDNGDLANMGQSSLSAGGSAPGELATFLAWLQEADAGSLIANVPNWVTLGVPAAILLWRYTESGNTSTTHHKGR